MTLLTIHSNSWAKPHLYETNDVPFAANSAFGFAEMRIVLHFRCSAAVTPSIPGIFQSATKGREQMRRQL